MINMRGSCKSPKSPLSPGGGGLGWGGGSYKISMLRLHPPPNPLPSREGELIRNTFARGSCNYIHCDWAVAKSTGKLRAPFSILETVEMEMEEKPAFSSIP